MFTLKPKICTICQREFMPEGAHQKYCKNKHYRICPICGKSYLESNLGKFRYPPTTCSVECRIKKTTQTSILKYGVIAPGNNPEAREKARNTMQERYGVNYAQESKEIHQKSKDTLIQRYGADNPQKIPEIRNKTKITKIMKKHNLPAPIKESENTKYITNRFLHSEFGIDLAPNVINPSEFSASIKEKWDKVHNAPLQTVINTFHYYEKCGNKISNRISNINRNIAKKLNDTGLDTGFEFEIDRKSYDIHVLNSDILIEINPSYTHNCIGNHWNKKGTHRFYHLEKTLLAKKHGFKCLHLWDWDCESKFINSLTAKHIIYAKTYPEVINKSEAEEFIDKYGLYAVTNNIPNIAFIGARYKTKLIHLMGFRQIDPILNIWELVCIENRFNYSIYNGCQEILEDFIYQYNPSKIISYADFSKTNGESLEALGFEYTKFILPTKIWSKGRHAIIDSPSIVPEAMLLEHWLPVYNCGYKVYEKHICTPKIFNMN